jgi:hypothetical protein
MVVVHRPVVVVRRPVVVVGGYGSVLIWQDMVSVLSFSWLWCIALLQEGKRQGFFGRKGRHPPGQQGVAWLWCIALASERVGVRAHLAGQLGR